MASPPFLFTCCSFWLKEGSQDFLPPRMLAFKPEFDAHLKPLEPPLGGAAKRELRRKCADSWTCRAGGKVQCLGPVNPAAGRAQPRRGKMHGMGALCSEGLAQRPAHESRCGAGCRPVPCRALWILPAAPCLLSASEGPACAPGPPLCPAVPKLRAAAGAGRAQPGR